MFYWPACHNVEILLDYKWTHGEFKETAINSGVCVWLNPTFLFVRGLEKNWVFHFHAFPQLTVKVTSLQAQGVEPLQEDNLPLLPAVPVTPSEDGFLHRLFAMASQSLAHLSLHYFSKIAAIWGDSCWIPISEWRLLGCRVWPPATFLRPPEELFS